MQSLVRPNLCQCTNISHFVDKYLSLCVNCVHIYPCSDWIIYKYILAQGELCTNISRSAWTKDKYLSLCVNCVQIYPCSGWVMYKYISLCVKSVQIYLLGVQIYPTYWGQISLSPCKLCTNISLLSLNICTSLYSSVHEWWQIWLIHFYLKYKVDYILDSINDYKDQ